MKKDGKVRCRTACLAALLLCFMASMTVMAQTADDDDIWKEFKLDGVDYQKKRSYCMRIYGYYRYVDNGIAYFFNRQQKLYRVYEGICELDVRYSREEDDGAQIMVGRDLVHPDQKGDIMDFYELKPYTFLEKARKMPKVYTVEEEGDVTRVYAKNRLCGTVTKDAGRQEMYMKYDALAPDTSMSLNLLLVKARLSNIQADAVYQMEEGIDYVPQGNLKRIVFDGNIDLNMLGGKAHEVFSEHTELYVDSVVYMTKDQFRADKKLSMQERRERAGYTDADIDRLKQKLGVPPLSEAVRQRIEDQRDWDDQYELWKETHVKADKADKNKNDDAKSE